VLFPVCVLCVGYLLYVPCLPGSPVDLRNRAGAADVHASCCGADVAEFCTNPAHHQRLEFIWSVAASLFPPTAPVIMFLRMASEIPPVWQLALSIGLMVVSIWGVLWFSTGSIAWAF